VTRRPPFVYLRQMGRGWMCQRQPMLILVKLAETWAKAMRPES
jgi:hypothetical protein